MKIPNNWDTRVRLMYGDLKSAYRENGPKFNTGTLGINPFKLLFCTFAIDTVFYLPQRFRYCTLTEAFRVNCSSSQSFLLGLMKSMFSMDGTLGGIKDFSIRNFINCYSHFFRSTMLYSSLSICARTILYDKIIISNRNEEK